MCFCKFIYLLINTIFIEKKIRFDWCCHLLPLCYFHFFFLTKLILLLLILFILLNLEFSTISFSSSSSTKFSNSKNFHKGLDLLTTSISAKSLMNFSSWRIYSSFSIEALFLNLIVLLKFNTKLKLLIAFSLIVPKELKINSELINIAIKNILLSWLTSSSYAPKPSVSIKKQGKGSLQWELLIIKGLDHIPLVQGFMVGPTPKHGDWTLLRRTLLRRNDWPVLYLPTRLMIPTFLCASFERRSWASFGMRN